MNTMGVTGTAKDGLMTAAQRKFWDRRQERSIKAVYDYWSQHGHGAPYPLIAAATGYGKGRVTAALVAQARSKKVLLIAGTKNLLARQTTSKFAQYFDGGDPASVVREDTGATSFQLLGNKPTKGSEGVDVAIWQRLESHARRGILGSYGLTVVDEAHNGGTTDRVELLTSIRSEAVVGMTATAVRSSGDLRMPESYGFTVVDAVTLLDGLEGGWNCPFLGLSIDPRMLLPSKTLESNGELSLRKLYAEMRRHPDYLPGVAKVLAEHYLLPRDGKPGPKAILFVNRIKEEAVVLARELAKYGISVGLAINQLDAKRFASEFPTYDIEKRHNLPHEHADAIQVVISPGVIGEGYDNPAVELVAFAVPTMSATRYTQVIGRGARACRGKAFCYVLDFPWFIEGYGYSLTFGQFFRREDLLELENGYSYLGSKTQRGAVERAIRKSKATGCRDSDMPPEFFRMLPDAFRRINLLEQNTRLYEDAGEWLPALRVSIILGKTQNWVEKRLNMSSGESRKAKDGKILTHYPPSELERLRKLAEGEPHAGGWMNVAQIAAILSRPHIWVDKRLDQSAGESRKAGNGRMLPHYPRSELERLRKLAEGESQAGGWMTAKNISSSLGKTQDWVESHLDSTTGEGRKAENGKILIHYPPSELERLRKLVESYIEAEGWMTAWEMSVSLNRSKKWLSVRLDTSFAKERKGKCGRLLMHYPPSELERLRMLSRQKKGM